MRKHTQEVIRGKFNMNASKRPRQRTRTPERGACIFGSQSSRRRILRALLVVAWLALAAPIVCAAVNVGSSSWVWQNPLPQGNNLNAVSCPATNICYAVGDLGTILYFNGTSWSGQLSTVTFNLQSVSCPSTTTCFAAGDFGTIVATSNSGASW